MSLDAQFWRGVAGQVVADASIDADDAARVLRAVAEALRASARARMPWWKRAGLMAAAAVLEDLAEGLVELARAAAADLAADLAEEDSP